ncbi:MAG: NUDIX domain-containing protein [Planctomycetales bacterium]|nr:NUDIX domain-containing protein [Planctomycetales bacterium]
MSKLLLASGIILFTRTSPPQFLLLKHADRWDLPKGHAEEGESSLETALRETEEETGVSASQIEIDPQFQFTIEYQVLNAKRGYYDKRVVYYLGYLPHIVPIRLTEHEEAKWWTWPPADSIQRQTIDPLLASVAEHLKAYPSTLLEHDS